MKRRLTFLAILLAACSLTTERLAFSQDAIANAEPALPADAEPRRAWLYQRLTVRITSRREKLKIKTKLKRLTDEQVHALFDHYQRQLEERELLVAKARLAQALDAKQRLQLELDALRRPAGLGFAPVVNWLPVGAGFAAGGVIAPGGRHVRIQANPFFSNIPRVDHYRWGYNHRVGCGCRRCRGPVVIRSPRPAPKPQPRVWYDGIRTHFGVPPERFRNQR